MFISPFYFHFSSFVSHHEWRDTFYNLLQFDSILLKPHSISLKPHSIIIQRVSTAKSFQNKKRNEKKNCYSNLKTCLQFLKQGITCLQCLKQGRNCTDSLFTWFKEDQIKPNGDKFHLFVKTEKSVSINIDGSNLKNKKKRKLLGIKFGSFLSFKCHT